MTPDELATLLDTYDRIVRDEDIPGRDAAVLVQAAVGLAQVDALNRIADALDRLRPSDPQMWS